MMRGSRSYRFHSGPRRPPISTRCPGHIAWRFFDQGHAFEALAEPGRRDRAVVA